MKFKYKRFEEEFNYLEVLLPIDSCKYHFSEDDSSNFNSLLEKPQLLDKDHEYLKLLIELETGHVINWPIELGVFDFHDVKVVDGGIYTLMKCQTNSEKDLGYDGYVPSCIGHGGYGDYTEFEIDKNGNIPDWEFTNEDYISFLEQEIEDDY